MPLTLNIPEKEFYEEETRHFHTESAKTLILEHSLVSISKWESKWHKPFLNDRTEKSRSEIMDYVKCMCINNVPDITFRMLTSENYKQIAEYIDNAMTATTFREEKIEGQSGSSKRKKIITSEIIYSWMTQLNIPQEYQKWHINRLLTLIRVTNEEQKAATGDNKKMSRRQITNRNAALNAARQRALHTKG